MHTQTHKESTYSTVRGWHHPYELQWTPSLLFMRYMQTPRPGFPFATLFPQPNARHLPLKINWWQFVESTNMS